MNCGSFSVVTRVIHNAPHTFQSIAGSSVGETFVLKGFIVSKRIQKNTLLPEMDVRQTAMGRGDVVRC